MKARGFLLTLAVLLGLGMLFLQAQERTPVASSQTGGTQSVPAATPNNQGSAGATSLALGKKVFVERCSKCHGDDGSAALPDGLPLNRRVLSEEVLTKNVNGRLKGRSEEERRAVADYIKSFRKS
jgi:mono/diheme cytochrome c family protein